MASSVIKEVSGWESVTIGTNTYGICIGYKNPNLRMAFVKWSGGGTTPTSEAYGINFNLPSAFLPINNAVVPVRNGDNMEVRDDGTVRIIINRAWSGASIMYPTKS